MKKYQPLLSILLALAAAAPSPSQALSGDVTVNASSSMGDQNNAKYREYDYLADKPTGGSLTMNLFGEPNENSFFKMNLAARTAEDLDLNAVMGTYGTYKFNLGFRQFGHNFAYGASSLYSGMGSNHLTINDATQAAVQAAPSTTAKGLVLSNAMAVAGKENLALRRDQADAALSWTPKDSLSIDVGINYENRKGDRPYGGMFGFSNAVEIAEPIDYDTTRTKVGVEYRGKYFSVAARHELSLFKNNNLSVTYDNPLQAVSTAASPAAGRNALAPDNIANTFSLFAASKELPFRSRISAGAAVGLLRQNDTLLAATDNTATPGLPLALPRSSADAKVDTSLYTFRFTSDPVKKLHIKADYRYDQRENKTPVFSLAANQWTPYDGSLSGAADSEYVSTIKRTAGLETSYDIASRTAISLSAQNALTNVINGSDSKENEDTYKLSLNTRDLSWVTLRLSLERSVKSTDYPDYTVDDGELPWMRRFYEASKNTNQAVAMATFNPWEKLTGSLEYIYGQDKYPQSNFGLLNSDHQTIGLDLDYELSSRVTLSPSYAFEVYNAQQLDRQWVSGTAGDPYSPPDSTVNSASNWKLKTQDISQTPALTVSAILVPEKLNWKTTGAVAVGKTKLRFTSPLGTAGANDATFYNPQNPSHTDDSTMISINSFLDYKIRQNLSLGFGYAYQRYKVKDDFIYDGYSQVAKTGTGAYNSLLSMNTMPQSFNVNTVYVQSTYRF